MSPAWNSPQPGRFLSKQACEALTRRVAGFAVGGGTTDVSVDSTWTGSLRWARNQVSTSGNVRNDRVQITRTIRGAASRVGVNQIGDAALEAAVRRAERTLALRREDAESDLPTEPFTERYASPAIWNDSTYTLDAGRRAEVMRHLVEPAERAGVHAAGYLQVRARGRAVMTDHGRSLYYPYTEAEYSVTVRDPKGTGSGWAGVDWSDWAKIDAEQLSAIALDKCIRSRNPVKVEPGRYVAILEPQAVCDLVESLFSPSILGRSRAEHGMGPYAKTRTDSRIGERMFDERITVTSDCMDPMLGFVPFDQDGDAYYPVTWVEGGVLRALAYNRRYAVELLGKNTGLPASGAFHMHGGTVSVEEMIATTTRGVLVTRLWGVQLVHEASMLSTGYTRDGLWLIENGKISKPIANFRFTESPLFALNNVEQLGVPQRVYHPGAPVVVPPLKVRDFNFSSLADAV
jgi:predicted Zn-dependent protease